ncbi:hypothetical protein MNEG_3523 [Monoraphidium neglectum]|uniref:Uncharacterized protein n=1 Tax=Monoraphidium neglectum TaxID=145388 RepID=A0A0D2MP14_9CHLO|nr:hypothetical protein MNEG_3523 [Monoraphidium neglectum]KIZ04435.1 hypothetical protein MNEG_3523 [Monoraphidium neglectum]|eukprot:XP_013903454.1 hypothetical protein MNEG_3523 [Monoraphidium neglectum]
MTAPDLDLDGQQAHAKGACVQSTKKYGSLRVKLQKQAPRRHFDSGEFFLSMEGKAPADGLLAPADVTPRCSSGADQLPPPAWKCARRFERREPKPSRLSATTYA